MQKLIFFKIFLVFSLALFSCQSDNVTYEQESQSESVTPCNFQYVTQMQIDSFLKNSFTLVTKSIIKSKFRTELRNISIHESKNS